MTIECCLSVPKNEIRSPRITIVLKGGISYDIVKLSLFEPNFETEQFESQPHCVFIDQISTVAFQNENEIRNKSFFNVVKIKKKMLSR